MEQQRARGCFMLFQMIRRPRGPWFLLWERSRICRIDICGDPDSLIRREKPQKKNAWILKINSCISLFRLEFGTTILFTAHVLNFKWCFFFCLVARSLGRRCEFGARWSLAMYHANISSLVQNFVISVLLEISGDGTATGKRLLRVVWDGSATPRALVSSMRTLSHLQNRYLRWPRFFDSKREASKEERLDSIR